MIMIIHFGAYVMAIVMKRNEIVYLLTFSYLTKVTMLLIENVCKKNKKNIEIK